VTDLPPPITRVRVLGGVSAVAADGTTVDLPSASQRRLLALLALHAPRRLRAEWLADALHVTPGALRTSVSRVRSTVGAAMLETASTGYALIGDVDASRFCRAVTDAAVADDRIGALRRAIAEWNGPALEEFAGEEWADGEIARLSEIHAGTVDDLADALIAGRQAVDAVALLETQIARYPYRDRPRGLLIRALASAGRQADALRAFQDYRTVLAEEFGTDPSPDVVRVERRVATGWDGVDETSGASTAADADDSTVVDIPLPSAFRTTSAFVGRDDELAHLAGELVLASASGLRCVLLNGEPGIGKTALLGRFAEQVAAAGDAIVAYGRCDESGASLQPFRSVLGDCVEHAPAALVHAHVAHAGGELARICPALTRRVPTAPAPTASDDATERFLLFEAAADLLRRVAAARPLLLILDDMQWAEPTALLFLRHLARALADAPVLVVLSSRDPGEDESEPLRRARADLERGQATRLQLDGLDTNELDALVAAHSFDDDADAPQVVEALRAQTAGNPLYAAQLLGHWTEAGFEPESVPSSLRDVVWTRVKEIGASATDVLTAASVFGVDFYEDALLAIVELPATDVIHTLDAAARAGLVVDVESPNRSLRFAHALVAGALYADIGASRRAHLHRLAAAALTQNVGELPPGVVVQLARHCALAGQPADAQRWSTRAGDHALDHLAPAEAARHYRVALDIATALERSDAERADLLVRLGDAQHRAGDTDALATLEEGARLAQRSGATAALVRAAFAGDRGFMRVDLDAPEYLVTVRAALAATDPSDRATYARLRALLARSLMYTPDAAGRLAAAHEALDLATQQGDAALLAQVAPPALYALWEPARRTLRSRVAADAILAAETTGDPRLEFGVHLTAYTVAVEGADPVVAARSLARMRAIVRLVGEPRLRWTTGIYDAFDATMAGRLDEAEALAAENLDRGLQIGEPDAFTIFAGQLYTIAAAGGRHEELLPVVEQARADAPGILAFELAYGIICAALGREEIARDILHEGIATRLSEMSLDNLWTTSVIGYCVLAIELDDAAAAEVLLPLIEPFASEVAFNGATSQGPIAAYVGRLASLLGRHDEAEEWLLVALDIATAFGWMYHRATTLFALAQARHRRAGTLDAEAQAWLADAAELCRAWGFRSWLPQIEALAAVSAP
jgi:DNA-binding SARP family transcriptional activator